MALFPLLASWGARSWAKVQRWPRDSNYARLVEFEMRVSLGFEPDLFAEHFFCQAGA